MSSRFTMRNVLGLFVAGWVTCASIAIIHATAIDDSCSYWTAAYHDVEGHEYVSCQSGVWQWSGSWDFSGMDNDQALSTSNAFCNDWVNSCWNACNSSDYKDYLAWNASGGSCTYSSSCFEGIGNASCAEQVSGTASCGCMGFNQCTPC